MNQNFEKKINQNNENFLENLSKKILLRSEVVNKLYNLFIPADHPNNPRNRYVLERDDIPYTIPYLSQRLGLSEKEVFNIFNQLPFCKIVLHKNRIPVIYFTNFSDFKKFILRKYKHFFKIEKIKKDIKNNKTKNKQNISVDSNLNLENLEKDDFNLFEKLKNLDKAELAYLKLVIKNNPSGVFNANRSGIHAKNLDKALKTIHYNKYAFFNKCVALGLMERIEGPQLKIKEEILYYFA